MAEPNPQEILTLSQSIVNLMPVIIGGAVGLLSSVVGGIVLHNVQSSDKKEQLKVEKMERAALLAYECMEWINKYESEKLFNGPMCTASSPLNELKTLCYLYIPDAKDKLILLDSAFCDYKVVITTLAQEKINNNGMLSLDAVDRIKAIYRPFKTAVDNFVEKVETLIQP